MSMFIQACEFILDRATAAFTSHLKALVVFGSYARLTPRKNSDIDLLIVVGDDLDEKVGRQNQNEIIYEFAKEFPGKVLSPVLMTEADFIDNVYHPSPLLVGIFYAHDVLYGADYFAEWMDTLEKEVIAQNLSVQGVGFRYSPRMLVH